MPPRLPDPAGDWPLPLTKAEHRNQPRERPAETCWLLGLLIALGPARLLAVAHQGLLTLALGRQVWLAVVVLRVLSDSWYREADTLAAIEAHALCRLLRLSPQHQ